MLWYLQQILTCGETPLLKRRSLYCYCCTRLSASSFCPLVSFPALPFCISSPSFFSSLLITTSSLSLHGFHSGLFLASIPTGNLFTVPQALHSTTSTSAHDFRPPRLLFSTLCVLEVPGIKRASQRLQIVCLRLGERRSTDFCATVRAVER